MNSTDKLIQEISKYLIKEPPKLIKHTMLIDYQLIEFLRSQKGENRSIIKKMFETIKAPYCRWTWIRYCKNCKKLCIITTFKKVLLEYIFDSKFKNFLCDECQKKENEKEKCQQKESQILRDIEIKNETETFINSYLTPTNKFKVKYKDLREWIWWLDESIIKNFVDQMPYHEFLKTPYWRAIANYIKYKNNYKCQLCSGTFGLSVHHRSYKNKGLELWNKSELICLCTFCHQKFHED